MGKRPKLIWRYTMKKILTILFTISALMLTACSSSKGDVETFHYTAKAASEAGTAGFKAQNQAGVIRGTGGDPVVSENLNVIGKNLSGAGAYTSNLAFEQSQGLDQKAKDLETKRLKQRLKQLGQ